MKKFKIIEEGVTTLLRQRIQCLKEKREELSNRIDELVEQRSLCCYDNDHALTNNESIITNNGEIITLDIEL